MGTCIICGTSVEGHVCTFHEEDVAFTFQGSRPDELTEGRYYSGTVDGIADFGVFVTIGDTVTGLLHRSELDVRLESLDWREGDSVFTQVLAVHENGNVDLGWSIRQSSDEFREKLIDTGSGERLVEEAPESEPEPEPALASDIEAGDAPGAIDDEELVEPPEPSSGEGTSTEGVTVTRRAEPTESTSADQLPDRVPIEDIEDRVGSRVTIEGRIIGVRQTSGPTIFTVRDESGVVKCAAFDGPGVRAYPSVDAGSIVQIFGEVERRQGELQVETETLRQLEGEEAEAVRQRLEDAVKQRAEPEPVDPLADHPPVQAVRDSIHEAATVIRRAIIESRPIVVRHPATADGYVASAVIERAVLPLLREEHDRSDAEYHFFDRRPIKHDAYDMGAATADITRMLTDRDRYDEKLPLIVLVGTGSTAESLDGIEFLDVYDVDRLILNAGATDEEIANRDEQLIATDDDRTTTTAISAAVAVRINPEIRDDVAHLPAVSYWADPPEAYIELASNAGYDRETARELREAVALEAYYQSYEDKRELIADLLFERETDVRGLASHVSEQFRSKLETALRTARGHVEYYESGGIRIAVLDTDAYTHRFDFPPSRLVVDALHRTELEESGGPLVTVGLGESDAVLKSSEPIQLDQIVDHLTREIPAADPSGVPDRRGGVVRFLAGERKSVEPALIDSIVPAVEV